MRDAALLLLLLVISSPAVAGWVRVGGNSNVGVYADPATVSVSVKNRFATMSSLLNFSNVQTERSIGGKPYRSQKDTREYDCINERQRLLRFSLRADFMLGGELVRSKADDGEWHGVEPGTLGAALLKLACGKK
jgi:hypothetical protein